MKSEKLKFKEKGKPVWGELRTICCGRRTNSGGVFRRTVEFSSTSIQVVVFDTRGHLSFVDFRVLLIVRNVFFFPSSE